MAGADADSRFSVCAQPFVVAKDFLSLGDSFVVEVAGRVPRDVLFLPLEAREKFDAAIGVVAQAVRALLFPDENVPDVWFPEEGDISPQVRRNLDSLFSQVETMVRRE